MTERPRITSDGPPVGPLSNTATDQITFIGTATTLIQVAGFTILTDPNFLHRGQRAYVGMGLTTKRLRG
jgi:L-ascorbate metabolism protein UlaG (beta-lactamase superfamily)